MKKKKQLKKLMQPSKGTIRFYENKTSRGFTNKLPGPVFVLFVPLLVTSVSSDIVMRTVLLVTDQLWTVVLVIFLKYCHST